MKNFNAIFYTVTDREIRPSGKTEIYVADNLGQATEACLYTHRLHNKNTESSNRNIVHCPKCGTIAVVPSMREE